jgi:hypothetical protein
MNRAVDIAMFGWIPVVLALFLFLPPRRAALTGFLLGWLFLPYAQYNIQGFPDYTKTLATCSGVLLGAAIFDFRRLIWLRPRLVDIPIVLLCLSAFASALSNGLGLHEGLSAAFSRAVTWGIPYAIGRMYFADFLGLRELAIGIFAAGLVYVPFCVFELIKGPELHHLIYGYYQPFLDQEPRFGILRPMVFLDSGLMLAVWMSAAAVLGLWLWKSRALPSRLGSWAPALVPVLAVMVLLIRSVNGWLLFALGAGLLALHSYWRSAAPLIGIVVLILAYVSVRATGLWSGEQSVPVVQTLINPAKASSIGFRLRNEDIIVRNVLERPVFGWGRLTGGANNHRGGLAVRDSLWIVVFGECGFLGLIALMATLLLPVMVFVWDVPGDRWQQAGVAPAAALAVVMILYTLDNLANGMVNPVFMLAAGGLSGLERKN